MSPTEQALRAAAAGVQRSVVNKRGHIRNLEGLTKGRRSAEEMEMERVHLRQLERAERVLDLLLRHVPAFESLVEMERGDERGIAGIEEPLSAGPGASLAKG